MLLLDVTLMATLFGCFAGSAALSAAEVSIIRVRAGSVATEVERGGKRAARLQALLDDLPLLLNAILLVALGMQVTAATVAGVLADRWLGRIGVTAATIALTAVLFVYAEAIPKTWAIRSPQAAALRLTPVLVVLVTTLRPLVVVLVWFAGLHTPGQATAQSVLTEDELRDLAAESARSGEIEHNDVELMARSFEFNDRVVGEVMVPLGRMVTVSADAAVTDALNRAIVLGHRRLPVREPGGDIVGVVRLRDLAAVVEANQDTDVESITLPILRSAPDEAIPGLLKRMQTGRSWMAIVNDHSGASVGLVTVEDLVAELLGEIDRQ